MSDFETVNLIRRAGAATIELNRPDSMNAWNATLAADITGALNEVAADDAVRAVCITGAGRAFSSGADLREIGDQDVTPDGLPDVQRSLMERYHPVITGVRTLPKPVLAAVNGPAVGIGLSLALAADLVVARESAYFLLAFVNIGLVPDGGASLFVAERVGFARSAEMAMLGERVGATQAVAWGLINRAYPDDAFASEVDALMDRLATGATAAHAGIKRQLNTWLYERMDAQLALEAEMQQRSSESDDFREGVTAFLEKRPARFTGS